MHYYELFELEYFVFSSCQSQLPADGVPVTRQRVDRMKQMFDNYIRTRTLENWKFWIVSFDFSTFNCDIVFTNFNINHVFMPGNAAM